MTSGLEVSLCSGISSAKILPVDRGVPPFSFAPQGGKCLTTSVTASQWRGDGQHPTRVVYVGTAMAEHQRHENKGMKEPVAAVLKSSGSYRSGWTGHRYL